MRAAITDTSQTSCTTWHARGTLAWGYVDQPPLIAAITWLGTALWGESLPAIRFLPALAGVGKILLTGLIARELGGGRFAQGLAAISVLLAPGFLGIDNLLSMNAYEPLFWLGCAYLVLRIVNGASPKLWLVWECCRVSACSTSTRC